MKNKKSLIVFLRYADRYKFMMIAAVLFSIITSLMAAVPAWLSKYLVDKVLVNKDGKMMLYIIGAIFVTTLIKVIAGYLADIISGYASERIRRDIRIDVFKHLQRLPFSYFKNNKLGELMARLSGDSTTLGRIGFLIFDMLKEFVTTIALIVQMFTVDWILSLVSLTVLPGILHMVRKYTKKIRKSGRDRQDTIGDVTAFVQEALSGIFVIKGFNRTEKMVERFEDVTEEEFKKIYKTTKIKAKISPINEVLATMMVLIVAAYGGYKVVRGDITPGDLIKFLTAIGLMQQPLKSLIRRNSELQEAIPSADRVVEILDIEEEKEYFGDKPIDMPKDIQNIKFSKIDFFYDKEERKAIKNFTLDVKKGEVIALVGKSGSGKTTLVNLIPRYYDVNSGKIEVNGIDIKKIPLKQYRASIGIVPQETFLFSGTIAENIGFGKDNVPIEDIYEAAKMANAYEFIKDLPNGFDTEVGERGVILSGGQKQRIAIARAIIQNPTILILDEATSALDTESERVVQDALDKLMKDRTTFVIAHRLSTIVNADKIVVMNEGEIKEIGTHKELLSKNGMYKKLYDIQFNSKEKEKK